MASNLSQNYRTFFFFCSFVCFQKSQDQHLETPSKKKIHSTPILLKQGSSLWDHAFHSANSWGEGLHWKGKQQEFFFYSPPTHTPMEISEFWLWGILIWGHKGLMRHTNLWSRTKREVPQPSGYFWFIWNSIRSTTFYPELPWDSGNAPVTLGAEKN